MVILKEKVLKYQVGERETCPDCGQELEFGECPMCGPAGSEKEEEVEMLEGFDESE